MLVHIKYKLNTVIFYSQIKKIKSLIIHCFDVTNKLIHHVKALELVFTVD